MTNHKLKLLPVLKSSLTTEMREVLTKLTESAIEKNVPEAAPLWDSLIDYVNDNRVINSFLTDDSYPLERFQRLIAARIISACNKKTKAVAREARYQEKLAGEQR